MPRMPTIPSSQQGVPRQRLSTPTLSTPSIGGGAGIEVGLAMQEMGKTLSQIGEKFKRLRQVRQQTEWMGKISPAIAAAQQAANDAPIEDAEETYWSALEGIKTEIGETGDEYVRTWADREFTRLSTSAGIMVTRNVRIREDNAAKKGLATLVTQNVEGTRQGNIGPEQAIVQLDSVLDAQVEADVWYSEDAPEIQRGYKKAIREAYFEWLLQNEPFGDTATEYAKEHLTRQHVELAKAAAKEGDRRLANGTLRSARISLRDDELSAEAFSTTIEDALATLVGNDYVSDRGWSRDDLITMIVGPELDAAYARNDIYFHEALAKASIAKMQDSAAVEATTSKQMNQMLAAAERQREGIEAKDIYTGALLMGVAPRGMPKGEKVANDAYADLRKSGISVSEAADLYMRIDESMPTNLLSEFKHLWEPGGDMEEAMQVLFAAERGRHPNYAGRLATDAGEVSSTAWEILRVSPYMQDQVLAMLGDPAAKTGILQAVDLLDEEEVTTDDMKFKDKTPANVKRWQAGFIYGWLEGGKIHTDPDERTTFAKDWAEQWVAAERTIVEVPMGEPTSVNARDFGVRMPDARNAFQFAFNEFTRLEASGARWVYAGEGKTWDEEVWGPPPMRMLHARAAIPQPNLSFTMDGSKQIIPAAGVSGITGFMEWDPVTLESRVIGKGDEGFGEMEAYYLSGTTVDDRAILSDMMWKSDYGDISLEQRDRMVPGFVDRTTDYIARKWMIDMNYGRPPESEEELVRMNEYVNWFYLNRLNWPRITDK